MATSRVGVRELKNTATQLVRRAAAGERIIVTLHGRAVAALVPASEVEETGDESPRMTAWRRERAAFERLLPRLARRFDGQYVAIQGGKVVGSARESGALFARLWPKSGGRAFFVGRVGDAPELVEMPGFVVE